MKEVSIVVPVYNVEKWLPKCLESILGQTFGNFELILVNDGSKDRSLEICREYETRDSRVKVIDGPNRGSSAARNTGLEQAQGNWIIFCDSDDWWDRHLLDELYSAVIENDADISACNLMWEYADKKIEEKYEYGPYESSVDMAFVGTVYCSLCNKLVKRSLFCNFGIKGTPGVAMWDDVFVTSKLRYHSKRTIIVDKALYHYNRMVDSSQILTYEKHFRYPYEQVRVTNNIERYFKEIGAYDEKARFIVLGCQLFLYYQVGGVKEWKKVFNKPVLSLKVIKRLFRDNKSRVQIICSIILPVSIYEFVLKCRSSLKKRFKLLFKKA